MIKQYLGIILSVIYAFVIRVLAEWNLIDLNSFSYLILTPMVLGIIPFFFKGKGYRTNLAVAIFFPLISVFLFLVIVMMTRLEDFLCVILIGLPYFGVSLALSIVFYLITRKKQDGLNKNGLSVLLLPVLFGMIEKEFPKEETEHLIRYAVLIDQPDSVVWKNLFAVPDLSHANAAGPVNYLGIPQPLYSTYDPKTNIRLGYFENGIVLHESVVEHEVNRRLTFAINTTKSDFGNSPTLHHVLKNDAVEFSYIRYELEKQPNGKTLLKLSAKYAVHSNLPFYGKFWSELIVTDFEQKLLGSLKTVLESNEVLCRNTFGLLR